MKNVHVFGGGTVAHITNHFALSAPAYGTLAKQVANSATHRFDQCNVKLELTKMADSKSTIDTNQDLLARITELKRYSCTKVVFMTCAVVDFEPQTLSASYDNNDPYARFETIREIREFGKYHDRLKTKDIHRLTLDLKPADKIVKHIRDGRKDIFLCAVKATCGATEQAMYEAGLSLCKKGSVNLVLVNDVKTKRHMIVTPEEAAYCVTDNRRKAMDEWIDMAWYRSHLTFTQSTVIAGSPVPWNSELVPESLRTVVNHCIAKNAYKVFNNATVGHFAVKLDDTTFLTSIRKSNFNHIDKFGLVKVVTSGPDTVLAYGAKPSVGGQSQRTVFKDHPGMDCIVHFHCPLRPDAPDQIPVKSQREVECGSHECGKNTSDGLAQFGNLKAVYLKDHGPNIVFNKNIEPQEVINFIERNFNLEEKTGGYNLGNVTTK